MRYAQNAADCFVKPPRKASSLTSSAFLAFDALYPFSLFKSVFRCYHKFCSRINICEKLQ